MQEKMIIAEKLSKEFPRHKEHIKNRLEDVEWQAMSYSYRGREVISVPMNGFYFSDDNASLTPLQHLMVDIKLMNGEEFEYNLRLELEELEAPFIEKEKVLEDKRVLKCLSEEPCGVWGD